MTEVQKPARMLFRLEEEVAVLGHSAPEICDLTASGPLPAIRIDRASIGFGNCISSPRCALKAAASHELGQFR